MALCSKAVIVTCIGVYVGMGGAYYSQRAKQLRVAPNPEIGADFCAAFLAYLERIAKSDYLSKEFSGRWEDGFPPVKGRLLEELGYIPWPINTAFLPPTERVLDLVEFFFRHVAKPTKWDHDWDDEAYPTEYSIPDGRYEYTVQVNGMFERFNHPYKLQKGVISRRGSAVLDVRTDIGDLRTNDSHLVKLLNSAVTNFFDRSGAKKLEALRSIVDAFERLKTLEGRDKKASAEAVIAKISSDESVRECLTKHFLTLTHIANQFTIRHHEQDRIELTDERLVEYLFYGYFNLVRLILEKYNMAGNADAGEAPGA